MKILIVGGGWSGVAAAISAKKAGAEVHLYEKTDLLLGLGNVGGIMRNNGRYTAAEELIALGGGDLIKICDGNSRHKSVEFPGHKHASLYDVNKIEGAVRDYLVNLGINLHMETRICDVEFAKHSVLVACGFQSLQNVGLDGTTLVENRLNAA